MFAHAVPVYPHRLAASSSLAWSDTSSTNLVMGSALYALGRSSHLPIPTLRFSCHELGPSFVPALSALISVPVYPCTLTVTADTTGPVTSLAINFNLPFGRNIV
jgi:hypothetical protein